MLEASLLGGLCPLDEGLLQAVIGLLRWGMKDDVVKTSPLLHHSPVGKLGFHLCKPNGMVGRPKRKNLQCYSYCGLVVVKVLTGSHK